MRSKYTRPQLVKFSPIIILLWIVHFVTVVHTSGFNDAPYELVYRTFDSMHMTERSGLIELICRSGSTAQELPLTDNVTKIWLNRTSVNDPDLQERGDVRDIEIHGCCRLRFNLTSKLEGKYTCGRQTDIANVQESLPKQLICKKLNVFGIK